MFTAVIEKSVLNNQVFPVFAETSSPSASLSVHPTSGEWGFIDENELVNEMTACFSRKSSQTSAAGVDADDFERLYQCFLS